MLKRHIDLAARLQHFPGAFEAGRDDEAIARTQGLAVAIAVTQHGNALHDLAIFVLGEIHRPLADGAKLVAGGKRILQETGGTYVEPTIFDGVSNAMKFAQDEIFGPVLSVITVDSAEEAVAIANDTPYGLAAAVWTADISKAHLTARALRAGSVWVNQYDGGDMTAPFGGFKQSGNGRDKSLHAFDKYTELKATWIKL